MIKIPLKYQILIVPVITIIVVIFSYFVLISIALNRVSVINKDLKTSHAQVQILTQKVDKLQSLNQAVVNFSNLANLALPNDNSTILAVSQLKNKAIDNSVVLSNLKIGPEI